MRGNLPASRLPHFFIDQLFVGFLRIFFKNPFLGRMERVDDQISAFRFGGSDGSFVNQLLKSEQEFRRLESRQEIIMVRYEDLHFDAENESRKIAEFLSMSDEERFHLLTYIQENCRPETVKQQTHIGSVLPNLPSYWRLGLEEYMVSLRYKSRTDEP